MDIAEERDEEEEEEKDEEEAETEVGGHLAKRRGRFVV